MPPVSSIDTANDGCSPHCFHDVCSSIWIVFSPAVTCADTANDGCLPNYLHDVCSSIWIVFFSPAVMRPLDQIASVI